MKERPILFIAPMVRAILEGRKTMTRRTLNPQPEFLQVYDYKGKRIHDSSHRSWCWKGKAHGRYPDEYIPSLTAMCHYGIPGDRLWVRETCRAHELTDKEAKNDTYGVMERLGLESPLCGLDGVIYKADGAFREIDNSPAASEEWMKLNYYRGKRGATVPPIHMPRWASRILLEITDVRVERLQEISEADAKDEGLACLSKDGGRTYKYGIADGDGLPGKDDTGWHWADWEQDPRRAFFKLWDNINGDEHGSGGNPWVWVVCFKRVK